MQPQLLPPNVVPHWYTGGPALAAWRGLPPVGDRSPEEWVGATVARFGEPNLGPARLVDGTLLRDAVRADPRGWLGRDDGEPGDTVDAPRPGVLWTSHDQDLLGELGLVKK